jgi:predicted membrane-bound dolichyl-phosphate-mannose-protein mannosyltransferase
MAFFCFRLGSPGEYVFDEWEYPKAAVAFDVGANVEPSHPPLGKMIIAAGIKLLGNNPEGWRIASAIAGALTLVLIYWLTRQLSRDTRVAAIAALLTAVNGTLFVLARTGTLDVLATMFLFAGLVGVGCVVRGDVPPAWGGAMAGCAFGLCMACKWMALIPLLACGVLLGALRKRAAIPAMLVLFVVAYVVPFFALAGVLQVTPSGSWLWAQQAGIMTSHASYTGPAYISSPWWSWPLKVRPQWLYDSSGLNGATRDFTHVLLLGNPVVMWVGLAALLALAYRAWRHRDPASALLCGAYVALYGQYIVMPLKTEFYHYYLAASLCLGPALALATRTRPRLAYACAGLAVWAFFWAYPAMAALPGGHWTRFF